MNFKPSTPASEQPASDLQLKSPPGHASDGLPAETVEVGTRVGEKSPSKLTIFAIPKPFVGEAQRHQLNAIRSWAKLAPQVEVLLLGDESGMEDVVSRLGGPSFRYVPQLARNAAGTPLLDSAFEIANRVARTPLLMYCNCDVILGDDLLVAADRLGALKFGEFVAFGRRTELAIERLIDFDDPAAVEQLQSWVRERGAWESLVCKEYFIFPRGSYARIPPFAVGRGNWDNWMIRSGKDRSLPVIDLSELLTAVHQSHGYSHFGISRWKRYVSGVEAKENERLAGGRGLIRGSTPTWKLDRSGLHRLRFSGLCLPFWRDLPRFVRFLNRLVVG